MQPAPRSVLMNRVLLIQYRQTAQPSGQRDREARLIVDSMPGLAWSAGAHGDLEYLNARFREYTGKRIEDVDRLGGTASVGWTELLHADDIDQTVKAWSHSVETGDLSVANCNSAGIGRRGAVW